MIKKIIITEYPIVDYKQMCILDYNMTNLFDKKDIVSFNVDLVYYENIPSIRFTCVKKTIDGVIFNMSDAINVQPMIEFISDNYIKKTNNTYEAIHIDINDISDYESSLDVLLAAIKYVHKNYIHTKVVDTPIITGEQQVDEKFTIHTNTDIVYDSELKKYLDYGTKNQSFLTLVESNNKDLEAVFPVKTILEIKNPAIVGLDPYSLDLTSEQKTAVIQECKENLWYHFREVIKLDLNSAQISNSLFVYTLYKQIKREDPKENILLENKGTTIHFDENLK